MNARVVNAIYPIMVKQRHIKVRSGKHIGISPFKKTKPSRESLIRGHLLQYYNNPSHDEFTILAHGDKKY